MSRLIIILLAGLFFPSCLLAESGLPIVSVLQDENGSTRYSLTLQLLALMTVLTLLPSLLLMMTSFVRIVIVMSLLRQALGTAQTPPNQVIIGVALFLTFFIMSPVFSVIYDKAMLPYQNEEIGIEEALNNYYLLPGFMELSKINLNQEFLPELVKKI